MAWTSPRTWVAGEIVTAAVMNTHVRDNLNAILSAADTINSAINTWQPTTNMTLAPTTGDIQVGAHIIPDTDNTYNLGSSDNRFANIFLTGGLASTQPSVAVSKATSQAIASTGDYITWQNTIHDASSMHSTASNTSRITIGDGLGGTYLVAGTVVLDLLGSGSQFTVRSEIRTNGAVSASRIAQQSYKETTAQRGIFHNMAGYLQLTSGDYLEIFITHGGGASNVGIPAGADSNFQATRISA